MGMDLVAAKHQKLISQSQSIFTLDESIHDKLISVANSRNKYPTIFKMEDYYSDTTILLGELGRLKKEIEEIMSIYKMDIELTGLHAFISKAISEQDNVYIMAD
jgi:hypothetical protein